MKLNWKVRFKNKQFLVSLIALVVVFVNQVAAMFNMDVTLLTEELTKVSETVLLILGLLGVISDPTTSGISDSDEAMTYNEPKKDK